MNIKQIIKEAINQTLVDDAIHEISMKEYYFNRYAQQWKAFHQAINEILQKCESIAQERNAQFSIENIDVTELDATVELVFKLNVNPDAMSDEEYSSYEQDFYYLEDDIKETLSNDRLYQTSAYSTEDDGVINITIEFQNWK